MTAALPTKYTMEMRSRSLKIIFRFDRINFKREFKRLTYLKTCLSAIG